MRTFLDSTYSLSSPRGAFAPQFPDYIEDVVLAADTLVRIPLPAGARFVTFAFDGDMRAKLGTSTTTLSLPASTTGDGSGSELNPAARRVPAKLADGTTGPTHLCLRAPAACKGSLAFYA